MITLGLVAELCHEGNRKLCASNENDAVQPQWERAEDWQIESTFDSIKFILKNPNGDDVLHNHWMKQKLQDGWIYGPERNDEKKIHPCLVQFNKLPREQQAKDGLFRAVVLGLLPYSEELQKLKKET